MSFRLQPKWQEWWGGPDLWWQTVPRSRRSHRKRAVAKGYSLSRGHQQRRYVGTRQSGTERKDRKATNTVKCNYARDFIVVFNASKSKCIVNGPLSLGYCVSDVHFSVSSHDIEIVDNWPHLGHIISNDEMLSYTLHTGVVSLLDSSITFFASLGSLTVVVRPSYWSRIALTFMAVNCGI